MKEKLTNNLGMKLLSLGFAAILWLVIVNVDNPVITKEFRDIEVSLYNESAIKSRNQVFEVISGDKVDIKVKGKRNIVESIRQTDLKAIADLSDLSVTYAVPIIPTCTKKDVAGNLELSLGNVQTLRVNLEDVATDQFKITTTYKGTVEDDYFVGDVKAKPNIITISGAKSQIENIDQVRVEIDVSNAVTDIIDNQAVPKVYDASGKQLDSKKFTFSSEIITVTADILQKKKLYLNVQVTGEPAYGYQYVKYDLIPKEVEVAGEPETISKLTSIPIEIDINGANGDMAETINITDYLPSGVRLAENDLQVEVNITIRKLQSKEITFSVDDITVNNLSEDMQFHFANPTTELTVKVLGLEEVLKDITLEQLKPYIDLKELKTGLQSIKLNFGFSDDRITIVNYPEMMINLTPNETAPEEEEETPETEEQEDTPAAEEEETQAEEEP